MDTFSRLTLHEILFGILCFFIRITVISKLLLCYIYAKACDTVSGVFRVGVHLAMPPLPQHKNICEQKWSFYQHPAQTRWEGDTPTVPQTSSLRRSAPPSQNFKYATGQSFLWRQNKFHQLYACTLEFQAFDIEIP